MLRVAEYFTARNRATQDAWVTQGRQGTSISSEGSEGTNVNTRAPPSNSKENHGLDGRHTFDYGQSTNVSDDFNRDDARLGQVRQTTLTNGQTSGQTEQNSASHSTSQERRRTTLSASSRWSSKPRVTPKPKADNSTGNGEYSLCMDDMYTCTNCG